MNVNPFIGAHVCKSIGGAPMPAMLAKSAESFLEKRNTETRARAES